MCETLDAGGDARSDQTENSHVSVFLLSLQNLSSLLWIVSSGISSGLFVVARVAGQLLTSLGLLGK